MQKQETFEDIVERVRAQSTALFARPRDPDRIPQILRLIERIWRASPNMRLGQLLCNALAYREELPGSNVFDAAYSLEDSEVLDGLEAFAARLSRAEIEPEEPEEKG